MQHGLAAEVARPGRALIRHQMDRFDRRFHYWSERERELSRATISER